MKEIPTIQQLKNFIIYGTYQNFTTAADEANITQSAFSAQMKKLEEILGLQLIERSNRGSHLTPAGEELLTRLTPIIHELEGCLYTLQAQHGTMQTLSIGTMLSLGDVLMNRHLAYYQSHQPQISLRVYNMEARALLQWLQEDKLDIVSLYSLPGMDLQEYEKQFVCPERIVYYAPLVPDCPCTVDAAYMASQPLAQYSPHYLMHECIEQFFLQHQQEKPETQAWFSTPYAIMHYCQQHPLGALLPERFLHAMGAGQGIHDVTPSITVPCYLVYKKDNPKAPAIHHFMEYMEERKQAKSL